MMNKVVRNLREDLGVCGESCTFAKLINIKDMDTIKINVTKSMEGFIYVILPSMRSFIKSLNPNFRPARKISVKYDTKSDFKEYNGKIANWIYPILLGVDDPNDLKGKVSEITFVNTETDEVMNSIPV